MKITVNKTIQEEIEIPKYFEKNGRFCKVLNDAYYMSVHPQTFDDVLDLVPNITIHRIDWYLSDGNFKIITKEEFDLRFLETERILNDLRKL